MKINQNWGPWHEGLAVDIRLGDIEYTSASGDRGRVGVQIRERGTGIIHNRVGQYQYVSNNSPTWIMWKGTRYSAEVMLRMSASILDVKTGQEIVLAKHPEARLLAASQRPQPGEPWTVDYEIWVNNDTETGEIIGIGKTEQLAWEDARKTCGEPNHYGYILRLKGE